MINSRGTCLCSRWVCARTDASAAGSVGAWLKYSPAYASVERYVSGVLLVGLGLTAAFAGNQRKWQPPATGPIAP